MCSPLILKKTDENTNTITRTLYIFNTDNTISHLSTGIISGVSATLDYSSIWSEPALTEGNLYPVASYSSELNTQISGTISPSGWTKPVGFETNPDNSYWDVGAYVQYTEKLYEAYKDQKIEGADFTNNKYCLLEYNNPQTNSAVYYDGFTPLSEKTALSGTNALSNKILYNFTDESTYETKTVEQASDLETLTFINFGSTDCHISQGFRRNITIFVKQTSPLSLLYLDSFFLWQWQW